MIDTTEILLETTVVQNAGNIVSDMDGEKVLLNIQKGKYYNLGSVGGEIWGLIKSPINVHGLVHALVTEYEVEKVECELQIVSFLNHLYMEGLIQKVD